MCSDVCLVLFEFWCQHWSPLWWQWLNSPVVCQCSLQNIESHWLWALVIGRERTDRFCVGETCRLLFGFCHHVSQVFSSVCYHGNCLIGLLSSHASYFTTSALACCRVQSYALNHISSVLGKSRVFRPYEGSRCSLWIFSSFGQSLNQSCQHWTYFFTGHQNHWFMMSNIEMV